MAIKTEIDILLHQTQGANFMLAHNYVLNADEQGLGKSLQSIIVQQSGNLKCLVICPATLKLNWKEEFHKFTDLKDSEVTVGTKNTLINIVNYENIYKCTELFMEADLIIIDESHYLINMDSQRTEYTHRLIGKYKPERLILLTGTPVKERVADFYSLIRLLSLSPIRNNGRSILDKYSIQSRFSDYFSNKITFKAQVKGKNGRTFRKEITKYEGIKNEDELKKYMKFKYIRRMASKVLNLPPLIFKDIPVSYKGNPELEKEWKKFSDGEEYNVQAKAASALATAGFTADYVVDLIKSGEKPIIVFSDHIAPLKTIQTKLHKKRLKTALIIGEVSLSDRHEAVQRFQSGLIDVILCSYKAAATGLTLTRSRNMILNDETWEAAALSQALKRFHRIGQTQTSIVHRVIGTAVGRKISNTLNSKREDIDKLI